ncbi:MAG: hypothetical protein ABR538_06270 [Candidatus Binatia bacterium]
MGRILSLTASGLALAAAVTAVLPLRAAADTVQVTTDTSGTGCTSTSPVVEDTGTIAAWESNCDPLASNADKSLEIFRAVIGSPPLQLTSSTACSSRRPSIDADGDRIAFESNCNLTGGNPDGNVEIFLWRNGTMVQLTASTGCDNLAPSISGQGNFIAFDSTCNAAGVVNDGRGSEIFRVAAANPGVVEQLTVDPNGGACDSTSASINTKGNLVAFDSDCDLTGQNEDFAIEIFTVTAAKVVKQRTVAPDDSCSSVRPSMDGEGTVIAFQSDCNFTGHNTDRSEEVFTVDMAFNVDQVSNAGTGTACASGEPRMASSGKALVYSGYCPTNGSNGDGSIEVFHSAVGDAAGGILAVTNSSNCTSVAGGLSADGTRVVLDSDCNLASQNGDGSVEVFRAGACACGAPSTRKDPPLASDALFTLRAAVGTSDCNLCECDTNDDGQVTASDALRVLKAAVGQVGVDLDCPVP